MIIVLLILFEIRISTVVYTDMNTDIDINININNKYTGPLQTPIVVVLLSILLLIQTLTFVSLPQTRRIAIKYTQTLRRANANIGKYWY